MQATHRPLFHSWSPGPAAGSYGGLSGAAEARSELAGATQQKREEAAVILDGGFLCRNDDQPSFEEAELNFSLTLPPSAETAMTTTRAMNTSRNTYSTRLAPRSSVIPSFAMTHALNTDS